MADVADMPKYDGMEYEELVSHAQFLWLENRKLLDYLERKAIIHGMYSAKQRSDRLVDENDKLRAENAKLRAELESVGSAAYLYGHKDLKAENVKLRELCRDLWKDALQFDGFWDYVYDDGTNYRDDELPHYQERMRELGIEVDG